MGASPLLVRVGQNPGAVWYGRGKIAHWDGNLQNVSPEHCHLNLPGAASATKSHFHLTGAIRGARKTTTRPVLYAILALDGKRKPPAAARQLHEVLNDNNAR
jgi:hypothetical protein